MHGQPIIKTVIQLHDMEEYPCTLKLSDTVTVQAKVHYAHAQGCGQIMPLVTSCACTLCDVLIAHPRLVSRFASYKYIHSIWIQNLRNNEG